MTLKKYCLAIGTYKNSLEILKNCKKYKIVPILFIKYSLINRLSVDWFIELKNMLNNEFNNKFMTYVDVKKNYGLFISLIEKKINYIKVDTSDEKTLEKLKQIAKINKVIINPNFSILDLSKSKNINARIKNLYNKN